MVKKKSLLRSAGFALFILFIIFFVLFPFIQMLSMSLKYQWDWGNPSLIPRKINLEAYKELLNIDQAEKNLPDSIKNLLKNTPNLTKAQKNKIIARYKDTGNVFPFFEYFKNSFILAFTAAAFSGIIAIFGAYSFSRMQYRGRSTIQRSVLFVYMFGGIVLLIPLYRIFVRLGVLSTPTGTFITLIVIYMVQTLPVSLYMLGNYFRTIPYSIEEAAMIEGLGRFSIIVKIIIPLSLAAIMTVFIYSFMIAWNEYLFASIFLKGFKNLYTLPMGLMALFTSKNAIWDRIMAASMLTALPVIALFMVVQKNLAGGLSEGGVKE
ncbi:MAG: carbohydrate ABC transporter permease [Spirochaetes bacterium]|nr:MAG: carbohydrate ABC transporter permease [Spirochaetota bacterium]